MRDRIVLGLGVMFASISLYIGFFYHGIMFDTVNQLNEVLLLLIITVLINNILIKCFFAILLTLSFAELIDEFRGLNTEFHTNDVIMVVTGFIALIIIYLTLYVRHKRRNTNVNI